MIRAVETGNHDASANASVLGTYDVLEQLAEAAGIEFDPLAAKQAIRQGELTPDEPAFDRLARAAKDLGLALTPVRLSAREALAQVKGDSPLVAIAGMNWVVLALRNHRAVLGDGRSVGERELNRVLGTTGEERLLWGAVQPLMQCNDVAHTPGPEDHDHHSHRPSPLRRLWGLLRIESRDLWIVVVFSFFVGFLSLATPFTVDAMVTSVQGGNYAMLQAVIVLDIILLACLLLAGAMRAMQNYIVEFIQRRIFVRVVGDLAFRLPRVKVEAFERQHGPELVNRFFDVLTVQKAGATLLLDGVAVIIQAGIGLMLLAMFHPYLLGFNVGLLIALLIVVWVMGRGAVTAKITESFAKYAVAGWLEEMARHPLAFKQSSGQEYAMDRADSLARRYLTARHDSFRILFRQIVFGLILQAFASTALLGLGGYLVICNELTIGQMVAAELIVTVIVGSFIKLGKSLESFYDLMAAMDKLGHLLDLPLESETGERLAPLEGPAGLKVHHVNFSFGDHGHGVPILSDVNFEVKAGERVALGGPGSSGKSTLVDLLFGLREPTAGRIELDGIDLREMRLDLLRRQVVSVANAEVFEGSVIDNVRLNRPGVSLRDVRHALEAVGLLEDVLTLPQGLNTRLSTGGPQLSRGQIARLMLARAIAGRPRLLILDALLDQLAPEVRKQILPSLFDKQAPWTLLVVSHLPDVLEACDRVIELQRPEPSASH